MSRTVIGYQDRRPIYRDDGPAYARRQGFGGAAIGHYTTTFIVKHAAAGAVDPIAAAGHRSASQQRAVERKRRVRELARHRRST